jgi:hypothetical protein
MLTNLQNNFTLNHLNNNEKHQPSVKQSVKISSDSYESIKKTKADQIRFGMFKFLQNKKTPLERQGELADNIKDDLDWTSKYNMVDQINFDHSSKIENVQYSEDTHLPNTSLPMRIKIHKENLEHLATLLNVLVDTLPPEASKKIIAVRQTFATIPYMVTRDKFFKFVQEIKQHDDQLLNELAHTEGLSKAEILQKAKDSTSTYKSPDSTNKAKQLSPLAGIDFTPLNPGSTAASIIYLASKPE